MTPLALVVSGATARQALSADEPITSTELAILAGVSQGRIGQLQSAGDAPRGRSYPKRSGKPRLVPADAAREWLSGRGVEV